MKNVICIIARTNSKRLEKKVLKEIAGTTMIEYIIQKMKKCVSANEIYMCTSWEKEDAVLIEIAKKNNIKYYAGNPDAPAERLLKVAEIENADNLVRVTGDNIFTDEVYLDLMFDFHIKNDADYTRTELLPIGVTPEIIKTGALKTCFTNMPIEFSEYLLMYMFQPAIFKCIVLLPPKNHQHPNWSLTVDKPDDWQRTTEIIGDKCLLNYKEIVEFCGKNKINHLEWALNGQIKMPGNFLISFKTFRTEMDIRIESSHQVQISEVDYDVKANGNKL
jgi:spore coat polysaccharide biosynthesis protein SpsF